jgi:hypothetical protein
MEILQWFNTGLHVILTGALALLPGTLVWTMALAVFLLIRSLVHAPWFQGLQRSE